MWDSGCEPELFENTLQLRERRLDLEEQLAEEKKSAELLKKECDTLIKKVEIDLICHVSIAMDSSVTYPFLFLGGSAGEISEEQSAGGRE